MDAVNHCRFRLQWMLLAWYAAHGIDAMSAKGRAMVTSQVKVRSEEFGDQVRGSAVRFHDPTAD